MNQEQVKSAVRWFITTFGAGIVNHGWASSSTLETIGGAVVAATPFVWSMFTHTQANAVAVVDTIAKQPDSPVKLVVTEPTEAGRDLANSLPGNTTVVAGSGAATRAVA
jgi:hypothetical protein